MIIQNLQCLENSINDETAEDTQLILQCAENIMGHLNRLIERDAQVKYSTHREVLSRMITSCEIELGQVFAIKPSLS